MKNQNLLDQFFLVDQNIVGDVVSTAEISDKDTVLEIGAGSGVVTRELVKRAGRVIAVEIDKKFTKDLKVIPGNVQLIFNDALKVLKDRKKYPLKFNKIVGSLPSSIVEPIMHILIKVNFEKAVFLVPLKFAFKLTSGSIFTACFNTKILKKVSRKSFTPIPKTNWAMIKLSKRAGPLKTDDLPRFLQQFVYEHPKAKAKNALVEGLIRFSKAKGKILTKNQARKILCSQNPP